MTQGLYGQAEKFENRLLGPTNLPTATVNIDPFRRPRRCIRFSDVHDGEVLPNSNFEKEKGATMNELISQVAEKTGLGEDKARQAAEAVISFLKTKFPGIGGQLDSALQGGAVSEKAGTMTEKVKEGLGGVLGKRTA
jgi:hypothetical protein